MLVDMEFPAMSRLYQFNLNENVPVSQLLEEIVEMICQKEQTAFDGEMAKLLLCSRNRELVLDPARTLSELQIREADRLILV